MQIGIVFGREGFSHFLNIIDDRQAAFGVEFLIVESDDDERCIGFAVEYQPFVNGQVSNFLLNAVGLCLGIRDVAYDR